MLITTKLGKLSAFAAAAALAWCSSSGAASFQPFVIRNASAAPNAAPIIQPNNTYVPGATEIIISAGGQKAGLGSSDADGNTIGSLANVAIARWDDRTRFTAGSGPYVAPYLNIWITDGAGRYAVVANEPSDGVFQPLYSSGYNLSFADLANKPAKIFEVTDKSWLPNNGVGLTFADLAGFVIRAPSVAELSAGWPGLGGGAPRRLSDNTAWGVNWIFGDSLANYVSGDEGYVVSAPTVEHLTVRPSQVGGAANNISGVAGDSAPEFPCGSFAAAATVANAKSELYFDPSLLFHRAVMVGEVKRMSYWTKSTTHTVDVRDWYLAIYTKPFPGDVSVPTWYGSRFAAEPYFSANLADTASPWNEWTTGGANNQLRFFESTQGAPGANFGSYTDPNWPTFIAGNSLGTAVSRKNLQVHAFSIQTGGAWANGFQGQLDGLTIELANGSIATVNFEPDALTITCPPAVSVAFGAAPVTTLAAFIALGGTVSDSCGLNPSVTSSDSAAGFCPTIITRTYTVKDLAGNSATCDQTITVNNLFAEDAIVWHQPLARNGMSEDTDPGAGSTLKYRFKLGSTIPIQIHAQGCSGDVTANANVTGKVVVFGDTDIDGVIDAGEPIAFDGDGAGGGVMDKIGGHLSYNLDTKKLQVQTSKCYILQVTTTDTSTGESRSEIVPLQAK